MATPPRDPTHNASSTAADGASHRWIFPRPLVEDFAPTAKLRPDMVRQQPVGEPVNVYNEPCSSQLKEMRSIYGNSHLPSSNFEKSAMEPAMGSTCSLDSPLLYIPSSQSLSPNASQTSPHASSQSSPHGSPASSPSITPNASVNDFSALDSPLAVESRHHDSAHDSDSPAIPFILSSQRPDAPLPSPRSSSATTWPPSATFPAMPPATATTPRNQTGGSSCFSHAPPYSPAPLGCAHSSALTARSRSPAFTAPGPASAPCSPLKSWREKRHHAGKGARGGSALSAVARWVVAAAASGYVGDNVSLSDVEVVAGALKAGGTGKAMALAASRAVECHDDDYHDGGTGAVATAPLHARVHSLPSFLPRHSATAAVLVTPATEPATDPATALAVFSSGSGLKENSVLVTVSGGSQEKLGVRALEPGVAGHAGVVGRAEDVHERKAEQENKGVSGSGAEEREGGGGEWGKVGGAGGGSGGGVQGAPGGEETVVAEGAEATIAAAAAVVAGGDAAMEAGGRDEVVRAGRSDTGWQWLETVRGSAGIAAQPAQLTQCIERSKTHKVPAARTNGYLVVTANGGLNQMRAAICDMVAVARLMNATLVLPRLDHSSFWADPSEFSDIFDTERFIKVLQPDIRIVRSLPVHLQSVQAPEIQPISWSNASYYKDQLLPLLKKHQVLSFPLSDSRLANNRLPASLQRLRCRANQQALAHTEPIQAVAREVVRRLRKRGPRFIALHLRYEKDMLAFTGCAHGLSEQESEELRAMRMAVARWKEKDIDGESKRRDGLCPLTPRETALMLRALGFGNDTVIYVAAGAIYGSRGLKDLEALFPNTFSHSTILPPSQLAPLLPFQNRLAAVDHEVSVQSDAFVFTYEGNMAKVVQGHRRFHTHMPTIDPDKVAIITALDAYQSGNATWNETRTAIRRAHGPYRLGMPRERRVGEIPKLEDNFFANPYPGCMCQQP
ncbi:unnamed protein product [Closterium sp. Yama58-4]|nr:unnamed protein product [Closterium sp. Yama58-4]